MKYESMSPCLFSKDDANKILDAHGQLFYIMLNQIVGHIYTCRRHMPRDRDIRTGNGQKLTWTSLQHYKPIIPETLCLTV